MKLRLLKLTSLLLVLIFLQKNSFAADPTIDLTVTVNTMSMLQGGWGTNCGNNDCAGVGAFNEPDPRIEFRVKNSSSSTWLPQTSTNDDMWEGTACGGWFGGLTLSPVGGSPQVRAAVPMNDLLNVQMAGQERDGGLSGGSDGVCNMQNIHFGNNNMKITSVQPCVNSDLQESRITCSSGGSTENYGTRWAWKWSWNGPSLTNEHAGQIAFNNAGNPTFIKLCTPGTVSFANIVSPIDPVPHTVNVWENVFWQRQREGSGGILLPDQWETLGFVGLTPTDNNLGLGRWHYRRVARFCTGDNGVLDFKDVISNEIIVEVVPQPVAPVGNKLPNINTVCVGQTITLQNVGYGVPEDAVTNCGIEYQYSFNNGDTWSAISNTVPSIQAQGNVDPTKSINIIRARVKGNCNYGSCNPSPWMERTWTVDYITSPTVSGNRNVCKGQTTTLTVTNVVPGATVKWYLDAALTNEVTPRTQSKNFTVNNNMSIWVLQSRDATGCPSLPTQVDLIVKETTASLPSSTPVICLGNSITPSITHTTTGATGIGTPTGLPNGVAAFFSGNTITISGVPTQTGTFTYNIPLVGDCPNGNATGIITVVTSNTAGAPSAKPTLCVGTLLPNITHTTLGATGIGAPVGLPAGVTATWSPNTIIISGTPTASGVFNYTIPLTGGCSGGSAAGTITVTPNANAGTVTAGTTPQCIGQTTTYTAVGSVLGGGTGTWSSSSPTVASVNPTTGVVTALSGGTTNIVYTITGGCDGTKFAQATYTVDPINTVTAASSSPSICVNTLMPSITHTTTGATGIGVAINLPAGVTANWSANTITISGTPTAQGTFNYSIPLTGGCGNVSATGTISVTNANTVSPASSSPNVCINQAITSVTHTTTGATGIGLATGMPAGISVVWNNNVITISGTPTTSGTFNYSIPLTGGCSSVSATGVIKVNTAPVTPTVSVTAPTCTDAGFAQVSNFDGTLIYTLSSNNISIDGSGKITGAAGNYTVTVGNGSCSATSASFSIASKLVTPAVPTVNVIAATCTAAGSAQVSNYNSSLVYTVSPNTANIDGSGKITGAAGPYTVTADNGSCTSTSATFTIDALISSAPTPVLSADNTTICAGNSALLTSDVTTVKWYRDAAKTDVLGTGTPISTGNLTATTTFYAENTAGSCIGALASITINVVAAPSAPTATKLPNKSSVCIGTTLTIQNPQYGTNSGNSCPFEYQSSTDAGQTWSAVSSIVPSLIADGTENIIRIRVSACNGCTASNWTDYSWTVISDTAAPIITGDLTVCTGASTTLVANAPIGSTVRWYSDNGLTTLVNTGTSFSPIITSNTSFFVTQTQDLCTSTATQVDVVALPAPAAPTLTLGHSPICGGQNTDLYSSSSTVVWYLDAAKSNRIGVGSTINTGTIYTTMTYYAADTSGLLCPSPLSSITVDVIPAPDLGNIVDVSICSGTSALLTGGSSATEWYSDDAMTNNINMGATYQTPVLTATTNYYLRVPSSCGVTLDTVTVTVKSIPASPTATDVEVCSGLSASIALSNVSPGATVQWYNSPSLDNMIHVGSVLITPILTSDAVYYVTQTVDGCTSPASSFNVYVKPSSNAPTLTANPNVICFGDASVLSSSSTATIWYSDAGQTIIGNGQTISVSPLLTTTYYAQDTAIGCSALASVTVKVDSVLPAPNIQDVTVCQGADAVLTGGNSGTAWYAADQTTLIGTGATIIVTNVQSASLYYARNEGSSCVSAFDDVTINITTTPPPSAADAEVCSGQSASLSAIGQNIVWYSDAGLTNAIQSGSVLITPALTSDVTYYLTDEVNGCRSASSSVNVTVTTPAPAPTITANPTSVCSGGTTELTSSAGANTVWYSDAGMTVVGSGSPFTTAPLLATATFYARDNGNPNCPGDLSSVQILISASEATPNVSNTSVCEGSSASLTGGTANTHWYSDASLTTEVNIGAIYTTPALTTATTYYLRIENGLCVSPVTEVTVSVHPIPAAPSAADAEVCSGQSASLSAIGQNIVWYSDAGLTNAVQSGSVLITPALTSDVTYYLTDEVNGCRSVSSSVNVTVTTPAPAPTITANPTSVCSGGTTELTSSAGANTVWYSDAGMTVVGSGSPFTTAPLLATATFYARDNGNPNCPGDLSSVQILISASEATPNVSNTSVCEGSSASLTGGTANTHWYSDASLTTEVNIGAIYTTPALTTATTYYLRNENGLCVSPVTEVTVSVHPIPAAPSADIINPICGSGSASLSAQGDANAIITWYADNAMTNALHIGSSYITPTLTANTSYYVTQKLNGCESAVTEVEVEINDLPTIDPVDPQQVCSGSTAIFEADNPNGYDIEWYSDPAGLDLWQIGDEFETPVLTQYTAWYYRAVDPITGCEGAIQSTWADVVSNKDITITATSKPTCVDEDIVVNVASYDFSGLVGIFDYDGNIVAVEDINGTTGGTQVILPGLPVAGVYSYYVVEAGDIFCATSSSTFTVEVVDRPVIDNVVGDEICTGEVAQITATATPSNSVITWYSDATLTNAVGTGNTLIIPGLIVNTTYYAVASNGLCASAPMDVEVVVNPIPATPELSSSSPVCEGSQLTLSTTTAGNVTYIWSGPAGFTSGDQNPVIASVTMANQGLYSLKVQDNVSGCTSIAASIQVNVNVSPTAPTASNSGAACEGGSAILSATTIPGATYEWTGPNGFSGSQQVIALNQVTLAQAGSYSVRAFVNGCWSSATTTDLVVNEKPTVTIPDVTPVCEGGTLEITSVTNSANPVYDWKGPNNYSGSASNVSIQDVKESKHQGAYTLQVTDGTTGCKSDVVATWVVINEKPNNLMAVNNGPKCEGGTVQLNATNIIGATYTWTGPDGFASQDRNPIITDLNSDKVGDYVLTITLGTCLSEKVTTTVEMNDKPVANAGDDITTQTNVPVKLNGSGGLIYSWSPANMLSFSNIPNPTFIAGSVGIYEMELTVTNEFGCSDKDTVIVNVEKSIVNIDSVPIPDLITPNGDGINDVWNIQVLLDYIANKGLSYEIGMYARGGSKIMISNNYSNDWDGTYKGKELPDGVYWYAIQLSNGEVFKGSLTIKR
ncbi:MAG: gliding motility-associated C-terminal domain-containing protein [Chitinophagales bacterium]